MDTKSILDELHALGNPNIKEIYDNHGVRGKVLGVKIGDMKPIQKRIRKNYDLSKELFHTDIYDAKYLAALIADEKKMTRQDLQQWLEEAQWLSIAEFSVAWIAAESRHGWDLGLEWIEADDELKECAGWNTLSSWVSLRPDEELDIPRLRQLLQRVKATIHEAKNRVRYVMNGFVISLGCYVPELTEEAIEAARAIGKVEVHLGKTACKVPFAPEYIGKVASKGLVGKKRKMARC